MKILIIRLSSAGDIILTSLFQRILRNKFPIAEIHFISKHEYANIIQTSPYIDKVITIKDNSTFKELLAFKSNLIKETKEYDLIFDLHNSLRSKYIRFGLANETFVIKKPNFKKWLLVNFKLNFFKKVTPIPELYLEVGKKFELENDNLGIEFFLEKLDSYVQKNNQITIGIAPGAKHFTKRWLPSYFSALAKLLISRFNARIIIFGSKDEIELNSSISRLIPFETINLTGKLTLNEAASVMMICNAMITNDSALMHIANSLKIPLVSIFGSTVKEFGFFPYNHFGLDKIAEVEELKCRPCTSIGKSECPKDHFKCMTEITPDDIIEKLKDLGIFN